MTEPLAAILLAAGEGTRMKSARPKPLHEVAGRSLLGHALSSVAPLNPSRIAVVVGASGEQVAAAALAAHPAVEIHEQTERLGTAHAVLAARALLANSLGDAVVLYADTPFVRRETIEAMQAKRAAGADLVILGFRAADPGLYGRLIMDGDGLARIVEAREATAEELAVTLCNSGVMMADAGLMLSLLGEVSNQNAKGEYYLTDLPALAAKRGLTTQVVECDEAETLGVDSRADLAAAEAIFQARARADALAGGVTMTDPATVWFAHDTQVGRDVTIEPNVIFGVGVAIEDGAIIRGHSHIEGAHIGKGAVVGPFARLRPGAALGPDARVGNFVEVKNAALGPGAKAGHLSYLGDATVGAGANIGAGTVTCNYDGVMKHHTTIGEGAFIGTHSSLIAPVSIGKGAYIATGSVISKDVADDALGIARARQEEKPGFASRFLARLRSQKLRRG